MSTQDDIAILARQVQILTQQVEAIKKPEPEKTERQIRDEAIEKRHKEREEIHRKKEEERSHFYPTKDKGSTVPESVTRKTKSDTPQTLGPPPANFPFIPKPYIIYSELHPWKVIPAMDNLGNELAFTVKVIGGDVRTQNSFVSPIVVPDKDELEVSTEGYVFLHIVREESSRAIESATIEFGESIDDSATIDQYIPLAYVTADGIGHIDLIQQLQFVEMDLYELMVVSNGEFVLATFRMAGRNPYPVPTP